MTLHPMITLAVALSLTILAIGCDESKTQAKLKTRSTIGKTTQEVRNLKPELAKGGQKSDGKIPDSDYLSAVAGSYRTAVADIAKIRVQSDMNIYETMNDTKIKTYEEFMENIIKKGKADGIQLPMLPYYQEYGYDPDTRELVVIEYPEKKKAAEAAQDKELGRK